MSKPIFKVAIKSRKQYKPQSVFQLIDDGIRKKLPAGFAERYKALVIENIQTNRFNFQLSDDWVRFKKRGGFHEQPFMMSGFYIQNISSFAEDGHLVVGFKKKIMHPRANRSLGELAMVLEFGDLGKNIPARPLWRKSFYQFREILRREGKGIYRKAVKV